MSDQPNDFSCPEAVWGADPLELHGGFRDLKYDPERFYSSPLGCKGVVGWTQMLFDSQNCVTGATTNLLIEFPNIDWAYLRLAYGWAASQYQAWARGRIDVDSPEARSFEIYTDGIIEFWLDDQLYFGGDFYAYTRAPPVVHLQPGEHRIDIRLVRDVRAMGGVDTHPAIKTRLELRPVTVRLFVDGKHFLAPDLVDGKLASELASVPVRNTDKGLVLVTGLKSANDSWIVSSNQSLPLEVAPGQTRPLSFEIHSSKSININANLLVQIEYQANDEEQQSSTIIIHTLRHRSITQPHKFTFIGHGGLVSFALIRAPQVAPQDAPRCISLDGSIPVFVFLHGAGVAADSDSNSHTLDAIQNLPVWTIFASGVTSWSGDDWHQWGWPDVEAAVAAIPNWIKHTGWEGYGVDLKKWFVAGHSNGGQGVWYALTHIHDRIIGAAPVSGYTSIQKYVPYILWHETDPRRMSVVHASMNSYRHELLVSNAYDIPIIQQHGDADDNVPCFHSRHMYKLIEEVGWQSQLFELSGKGHWFDGIMTTDNLVIFYLFILERSMINDSWYKWFDFTLVIANPADTGPKFGIHAEQLIDPGQLGNIKAGLLEGLLMLTTSNVRSLSLDLAWHRYDRIFIDQQNLSAAIPSHETRMTLLLDSRGIWKTSFRMNSIGPSERRGNQLGNLDAILRSRACFVIEYHHETTSNLAIQIARNLFQYFAADARVVDLASQRRIERAPGNLITLGMGASISPGILSSHPIRLSASSLLIRDSAGREREFSASKYGLAAIFLRPLEEERLEIVIWGSDSYSAAVAARLFPLMTGAGQPDFIIMTRECLWKGVDGTLAMGFFDSLWNVSPSSFLL